MPIATPQGTLDFKSVDKVTFVGASSNTVIDTTTGSLGVGVGVGGPTSNLHVVGDTLITGNVSDLNIVSNVNMLHTSNTAAIKLNSNVVTEFPRSKKLVRYPKVVMTTSTISEHTASASTVLGTNYAWHVFDTINPEGTVTSRWRSDNYVYTSNSAGSPVSGTAAQLSASSGTPSGEYILLTLPEKMCLKRYSWSGLTTQAPKEGEIWGSNDGSSWSHVHTFTNGNSGWVSAGSSTSDYVNYPDYRDVDEGNVAFYSRYAFIITKLAGADVAASVRELEYYGVPEYDPDAHGTDVVVKSKANAPNTDCLQVYYDAKNYTNGTITDESPNNYVGTLNGNTQLETVNGIKAFKFDGNADTITGTVSGISGEYVHSIAFWVKLENIANMTYTLFEMGARSQNDIIGISINSTSSMNYYFYSNDSTYSFKNPLTDDRWYHLTVTYSGGSSLSHRKVYLDGDEIYRTAHAGTAAALTLANGNFAIGDIVVGTGSNDFKGSVANFRFFNRALSQDEIHQLYAYQKEEFGHGDLSMTLKAGRLGIGTSEPRAMLDVRGHTRVQGDVRVGGRLLASVPYYAARQRDTNSYVFDESIVYDQYVYTNYPGSFVANSATDGYYQPPMNGVYQVHMECIVQGSGNMHIQRLTNGTVDISHDDRHFNYTHSGWMSTSADALIPITNHVTQTIRIYIDGSGGIGAWQHASYHGSAFFLWVSDIPERRQHHVG